MNIQILEINKFAMKTIDKDQTVTLALLQAALWHNSEVLLDADWDIVEGLAQDQGVLWLAYLGAKYFKQTNCSMIAIPTENMKQWRGVFCNVAFYNDQINIVQTRLVQWLAENKIRAAILKGTSCSRYYPFPEARPLGDIDVLVDRKNLDAVGIYLKNEGFIRRECHHGFHAEYCNENVTVEVHFAGTEVPNSKGGEAVAEAMKHFLDNAQTVMLGKMEFPVLSDAHQALMLLLHMERHMLDTGITLRQLCDWTVFVNGIEKTHWESEALELLRRCGMLVYAKVLTKACVNYLGLNAEKVQWCMDIDDELARAMLDEVFRGGNLGTSNIENMGSLFTDRTNLGNCGQNKLTGLLSSLTRLANQHFPFTQRHKMLVPVFWVFIPLRYLVRSIFGLRPKRKLLAVYRTADQRQKLYNALHLYEVK